MTRVLCHITDSIPDRGAAIDRVPAWAWIATGFAGGLAVGLVVGAEWVYRVTLP